jgi:hypothetical protein
MSYDYDYYSGRDLSYPRSPIKPGLKHNANSDEAMNYASALAMYEKMMVVYREQVSEYHRLSNIRLNELKTRLKNDYPTNDKQFDLLWSKAWEDSHSEGIRAVVDKFDELYDFVTWFTSLVK